MRPESAGPGLYAGSTQVISVQEGAPAHGAGIVEHLPLVDVSIDHIAQMHRRPVECGGHRGMRDAPSVNIEP